MQTSKFAFLSPSAICPKLQVYTFLLCLNKTGLIILYQFTNQKLENTAQASSLPGTRSLLVQLIYAMIT
jgi:hypothetical protein